MRKRKKEPSWRCATWPEKQKKRPRDRAHVRGEKQWSEEDARIERGKK
jgi:hypothetical protein